MPNIGPVELIIILVIALLILGPGRLPDVASSLGKSIREFRKAATDVQDAAKLDATPATPTTTPTTPAAPATPATPAAPAAPATPPPAPNTLAAPAEPNTLTMPIAAADAVPAEPVGTTPESKA